MSNSKLWPVHAFVEGLVANGVRFAVNSPGSRNTPLTLALAEHPEMTVFTHLDERSAAFFALGLAQAKQAPVVIVCTSGTATANYYPAVMEAFAAHVPLIVVTADRPPRLREVGANQVVRQNGMYAQHVKWAVEMPIPDGEIRTAKHATGVAARAAAEALATPAGPVHINYPLVEPLLIPARAACADMQMVCPPIVYASTVVEPQPSGLTALQEALAHAERPLVVLGPQRDKEYAVLVQAFCQRNQIALFADSLSQARFATGKDTVVIGHYDLLLDAAKETCLLPDVVLKIGAEPTSKSLAAYLSRASAQSRVFVNDETAVYRDANGIATDVLIGHLGQWLQAVEIADGPRVEFLQWWTRADKFASHFIQKYTDKHWFEGTLLRVLLNALPKEAQFVIGNSRPVRDVDALAERDRPPLLMYGNRGVSGIDGVVSTAFGIAAAAPTLPTVLCIGDVSFYHDLNGLLAASRFAVPLMIVLVHNDGGGIFQHLSQAERQETLDYFTTPHGLNFQAIIEAYGGTYEQVCDSPSLAEAVSRLAQQPGLKVIEARFANDESVRHYRSMRSRIGRVMRGETD
jgi:2-succinyl-5-enolpyruvyl-6-hydroxy-3-cyclohexene-1-carboxylate synthase